MTIYWSSTRAGFFSDELHDERNMPGDASEISDEEHARLLKAQADGMRIVTGIHGLPVAVIYRHTDEELAAELRRQRNQLLVDSDSLVARHRDQVESGLPTTFTPEQYQSLMRWREQLRHLPEHADWPNLSLPERPV